MKKLAFVGGIVVLPHKEVTGHAVIVEGGKIVAIQPERDLPENIERISLGGDYLLPGFVDIHVHGGGGADFMDATPDAMRTVAATHCAHGTTLLCPTTMTCPNEQLFACFDAYRETVRKGTGSADFLGLHLEGPYFASANRGAQPTKGDRVPTVAEVGEILARAGGIIARWDAAPELDGMQRFAAQVKEQGILLSIGHSVATAEETLAAYADGFTHVTHMYCATTTEHKRGQVVHGGIVEAAYLEDGITIELIADGKHIPKETMRLGFRLKGKDSLALITDAMRAAGTDLQSTMLGDRKNGVPVIIEEGVAKLPDRSSYAGSIATMDHALRVVHRRYGIPLCDTVRAMSLTPARLVGADDRKGSITPGKDADLVILTPDLTVRRVFVRGREFQQ